MNVEKVAPTGSLIATNTKISGEVSNGKVSATFSGTFDKYGAQLSSSVKFQGGSLNQSAKTVSGPTSASDVGSVSRRASVEAPALSDTAGATLALGLRETATKAAEVGSKIVGGLAGQVASTATGVAIPNASIQSGEKEQSIVDAAILDAAFARGIASATSNRSQNNSAVIGETQTRVDAAGVQWGASTIQLGEYWNPGQMSPLQVTASAVFNAGWIGGLMAQRSTIFDIGLNQARSERSSAYRMERQLIDLAQYPMYRQRQFDENANWNYKQQ